MTVNHQLLRQLGVSTAALNEMVDAALDAGALGAKLAGSGGGGVAFALVAPASSEELLNEHTEKILNRVNRLGYTTFVVNLAQQQEPTRYAQEAHSRSGN